MTLAASTSVNVLGQSLCGGHLFTFFAHKGEQTLFITFLFTVPVHKYSMSGLEQENRIAIPYYEHNYIIM